MEPVTQALLGAATGYAVAGRTLERRALGWGAAIGMSPDLDVLLGPLHEGYGEWLYHRGTTHSLWFGFVLGPLLGWLLWRWRDAGRDRADPTRPGRDDRLAGWMRLAVVALVTHPLLDGFTPYGTQFFAPFFRERFAWNGVAIVDPFYSSLLALGVLFAAATRLAPRTRWRGLFAGLLLSTAYLAFGVLVDRWVVEDVRAAVAPTTPGIERVRAYPTIFQPWLRSIVVRTPDATLVGLHSWQAWGCPVWQVHEKPRPSPALETLADTWPARLLAWFADGDVATFVHPEPGGVLRFRIEDVRYSWATPNARGMWGLEARIRDDQLVEQRAALGRRARTGREHVAAQRALGLVEQDARGRLAGRAREALAGELLDAARRPRRGLAPELARPPELAHQAAHQRRAAVHVQLDRLRVAHAHERLVELLPAVRLRDEPHEHRPRGRAGHERGAGGRRERAHARQRVLPAQLEHADAARSARRQLTHAGHDAPPPRRLEARGARGRRRAAPRARRPPPGGRPRRR